MDTANIDTAFSVVATAGVRETCVLVHDMEIDVDRRDVGSKSRSSLMKQDFWTGVCVVGVSKLSGNCN